MINKIGKITKKNLLIELKRIQKRLRDESDRKYKRQKSNRKHNFGSLKRAKRKTSEITHLYEQLYVAEAQYVGRAH